MEEFHEFDRVTAGARLIADLLEEIESLEARVNKAELAERDLEDEIRELKALLFDRTFIGAVTPQVQSDPSDVFILRNALEAAIYHIVWGEWPEEWKTGLAGIIAASEGTT